MSIYRSAQGKMIDMGALISKNEKTRAVGNMKVNARGDTIDSHGRIIKPVTAKVNEQYGRTVGNRSANSIRKPVTKPKQVTPKLTKEEEQFELEDISDDELATLKSKENK